MNRFCISTHQILIPLLELLSEEEDGEEDTELSSSSEESIWPVTALMSLTFCAIRIQSDWSRTNARVVEAH